MYCDNFSIMNSMQLHFDMRRDSVLFWIIFSQHKFSAIIMLISCKIADIWIMDQNFH